MTYLKRFGLIITLCLFSVIFLSFLTSKWLDDGLKPQADGSNDYAIVLGAKVNGTVPSLSLRYRLDAALAYAQHYPHVSFILSGGQGPDEAISEAEAMRVFLSEQGIASERLLLEDQSTSTYENIAYAQVLLPNDAPSVTLITSDYHLARAQKIAAKLGLATDVVAAKTPGVVEFKLRTRERIALLKTVILGK